MPKVETVRQDGQKIRDRRTRAGLTIGQFAKLIDCHPEYVRQFERDLVEQISEVIYARVCNTLAAEWGDLLKGKAA